MRLIVRLLLVLIVVTVATAIGELLLSLVARVFMSH
jgi:hypothetical protein